MRSGRSVPPQRAFRSAPVAVAAALVVVCSLAIAPARAGAQHPPIVRGEVVDASSGLPVPGATVRPLTGGMETSTGGDGRFELRGLLPGERDLRVAALGYLENTVAVEAENGRVSAVRIELRPRPIPVRGLRVGGTVRRAPDARIVTRPEIRDSDAADLAELLEELPGVTITRRGGAGASATASIRGSSPDEVLLLVDGVPANSLITGEADLSTVPLTGVERVLVLPGAQSVRYGPRALAGVILVQTRTTSRIGVEAGASAGSWGERSGEASVGGEIRSDAETRTGGLLAAEWRSGRGDFPYALPEVRGGGRDRRENADHDVASLWSSGVLERGSVRIRARGHALEASRGMPGTVVQPSLDARQLQRRLTGVLTIEGSPGSWDWQVRSDLQRQRARYTDPDPPLRAAYDDRVSVGAAGVSATAGGELGPLRFETGGEARRYGISTTMLAPDAPDRHETLGVWASARWRRDLGPHSSLSLSPGLRVDRSSLLDAPVLSPKATLSLARGPLAARLSVGDGFSPPALADQFFHESVLARPNPDLRPERVRGEVDGAVELDDVEIGSVRVGLQVSAYRSDVDGMILWLPDHRFVWRPGNFDVDRRGWEARAEARLPDDRLRARLGVSRSRVEYDGPSLEGQVAYRPATTANVALSGRLGAFVPRVDVKYVGSRRTVPGSGHNALPPYETVDASVRGELTLGGWRLRPRLGVDDLLDRQPAMLVDYPAPGRTWSVGLRVARPGPVGAPDPDGEGSDAP